MRVMVTTNATGNTTTPPSTLDRIVAPLIGALCVFATLTIWLDAAYAERCFDAAILALAAVVVVVRGPPRPRSVLVALTAVALWGPLQLIADGSVYRYETWTAALRWATLTATFFLAYAALGNRKTRQRSHTLLAAFGAAMAVFALVEAYTSQGAYFWLFASGQPQVFGPFQNPNNYAAFIELILPFTLWEGLKWPRYRTAWLTMAAAMAASVVASGSRAGSALVDVGNPRRVRSRLFVETISAPASGRSIRQDGRGRGALLGCERVGNTTTPARGDGSFLIPARNVALGDRHGASPAVDRLRVGHICHGVSGVCGL